MIITMMKTKFKKRDPKIVNFRSYKHFEEEIFREELKNALQNTDKKMDYDDFKQAFMTILNKHAPIKKRNSLEEIMHHLWTKLCLQAFMHRSQLKNKYNKNPTEQNKISYNKQRNYWVSRLKKEKRKYYNNLDPKIFKDNKTFWRRVKPLFSDKHKGVQPDIIIVENGETTSDKMEVAEKLNNFFSEYLPKNNHITENIQDIVDKYENNPSIKKIKENITHENKFSFKDTTPLDFATQIQNLDTKKAMLENDIPTKNLVKTNDIVSNHLSKIL